MLCVLFNRFLKLQGKRRHIYFLSKTFGLKSQKKSNCLDDSACIFDCNYSRTECQASCPCFQKCPNGCKNCYSAFCACKDFENNEDFKRCKNRFDEDYARCLAGCVPADFDCLGDCSRDYQIGIDTCPCQNDCPHGCPCPNYQCESVELESNTEVLILSTRFPEHVPIITNTTGRSDRNFFFLYEDETQVSGSCGVTWRNQLFIFGGNNHTRQISKLSSCKLEKVAELDFDFHIGGCASQSDEKIWICFGREESNFKKCRFSYDPKTNFTLINDSLYTHGNTRIAASDSR